MLTRIPTTAAVVLATAFGLVLAPCVLASSPTDPGIRAQRDLLATVDAFRGLLDTPASSPGVIDGLTEARTQIEALPPESFRALDPALLERLERLRQIAAQIAAMAAAQQPVDWQPKSEGFPVADYPVITFDFVLHASIGIPDENGATGGTTLGVCNPSLAPNAEMKFVLLNASLVGQALRDTARRLCEQTVIIAGVGANLSPICIISDIAYLLLRGIQDNMFLCAATMTSAEISGSYDRLEHIHDDLVAAESNLLAQIGVTETALVSSVNLNESRIRNISHDLAVHDQNLEQRVQGIMAGLDHLADELVAFRAEELRIRIECALADAEAKGVGVFLIPEELGGHLDLVHTIVADTISTVQASGAGVGNAERLLDSAWQLAMAGDYAAAYAEYGRAYRAATR